MMSPGGADQAVPETVPAVYALSALLLILTIVTALRVLAWVWLDVDLFVDEAQYWLWSTQPDLGYYSKPPMVAWLIHLSTTLLGHGELAIKAAALVLYPLTAVLVYLIGVESDNRRVGWWAALIFSAMPGLALAGVSISTDAPLLACYALATLAWLRALKANHWSDWLLLAVALGLGMLSKYSMVLFAAGAVLGLICQQRFWSSARNPRLWLAIALALALFAPNLYWNYSHNWPTLGHHVDIAQGRGPSLAKPLEFLVGQFALFGPLAFWWALVALRGASKATAATRTLLALGLMPLALLLIQAAINGKANVNWAAMGLAPLAVVVAALALDRGLQRSTLIASAALSVAVMTYPTVAGALGYRLPERVDLYRRVRGWAEFATEVSHRLTAQPGLRLLTDERAVAAQLGYYARSALEQPRYWLPAGAPSNHYAWRWALTAGEAGPFLYLSARPDPALLAQFAEAEALAAFDNVGYTVEQRRIQAYRLAGRR